MDEQGRKVNLAPRVLIVDDDERLCRLLTRYLQREGYRISSVNTGAAMRRWLETQRADLILLDLGLPDEDGLTLARELRTDPGLAIIMITGKGETVDRIVGLELGADDYLCKPFDQRELLARIHSVMRRRGAGSGDRAGGDGTGTMRFSGWLMDTNRQELTSPMGEKVDLTTHEFRLLAVLVRHPQHVLTRDQILQELSGRDWQPDNRSADVLIGKLRRKLESDPHKPTLIKTIHGAGYKFTPRVEFE
jgi:two-component system OmpR family response regulator